MDWAIDRMPGRLRVPLRGLLAGYAGGALLAFAIRVVSAGLAFVSHVLLARLIGAHEFGIFATVWVWVMLAGTLSTLGFSTSVMRFLPAYRQTGEHALFRGFLRTGHVVSAGMGGLLALSAWLFLAWRGEAIEAHHLMPLILGLACLPAYALTEYQDGVGRSQGWIDLALGPPYIARPLLLLCGLMLAVSAGWSASAATAAGAAIAACWIVAAGQHVLQRRRLAGRVAPGGHATETAMWLRLSLPFLLFEGFSLLLLNLDLLLLNLYVSPDQVGLYAAAVKTISLVSFVHFSVAAVAMPEFARLNAKGDRNGVARFRRKMQRWTFIPSTAVAAVLLLLGPFLLGLFGSGFAAAWPVMGVLAVGLLVRALAGPAQSLLAVGGHQNLAAAILGGTVLLNVVLNLLLIPSYGIVGSAVAAALAFAFEAAASSLASRRLFPA